MERQQKAPYERLIQLGLTLDGLWLKMPIAIPQLLCHHCILCGTRPAPANGTPLQSESVLFLISNVAAPVLCSV
jgi:hypothetical protein